MPEGVGTFYDQCGALGVLLLNMARDMGKPDKIIVEEAMSPSNRKGDHRAVMSQFLLQGALHCYAGAAGIQVTRAPAATVRKRVIGKGCASATGEDIKKTVRDAVIRAGLLDPSVTSTDQSDAVAVFAWASEVLAGKPVMGLFA